MPSTVLFLIPCQGWKMGKKKKTHHDVTVSRYWMHNENNSLLNWSIPCPDGSAAYKLRIFHMCREMKSKRMGRCSPNPPIYLNSKSGLQFPIVVLREPISCRAQIKQSNSRVVWGHDGRLRDCRTLTERAVEMLAEPSEGALVIDQALQHHHEAPCTLAQRAVGVLLQEVEELLSYLGQHCRHVVSGDWISMIQVHHSIF